MALDLIKRTQALIEENEDDVRFWIQENAVLAMEILDELISMSKEEYKELTDTINDAELADDMIVSPLDFLGYIE
ncbi:MAG: hypothetical protein KAS32_23790 [Candidatus Peribacteraceae bacterium]|nr:hypothetical protein [Candidatus Peribacteraceae bacterium]